jgi:hypothetical protein
LSHSSCKVVLMLFAWHMIPITLYGICVCVLFILLVFWCHTDVYTHFHFSNSFDTKSNITISNSLTFFLKRNLCVLQGIPTQPHHDSQKKWCGCLDEWFLAYHILFEA